LGLSEEWGRKDIQCQEGEYSGELSYSGAEVVYCETELKEQDPKKSKSLQRRGLAG
jgi:hypothetical protein